MLRFFSRIVCAYFAFLLPSFQTFKALSHRPLSEPDLERWSQYWAVIGVLVAFEYLAEFLIRRLPLYFELKTVLVLFLALPQTQGSTYIYQTYLQPFFAQNETELDADIMSFHTKTFAFAQNQLAALWQFVMNAMNKNAAAGQQAAPGAPAAGMSLDSAMGLFRAYAPSVLSSLRPAAPPAPGTPSPAPSAASSAFVFGASTPQQRTPAATPPAFPEPQHF
ncbi:TB2/DP1, HVA22 family-domain-containing protein [Roridomyces roridus]|uniref:Protein YOP1 n=1 Tax=Roridomyces roridus TaxID=1738132 RepID=A0AAD7BU26_9AGAR|nr:TB2/DP1, HVA22 family-domain-containing protein [Roridomyces roridus]